MSPSSADDDNAAKENTRFRTENNDSTTDPIVLDEQPPMKKAKNNSTSSSSSPAKQSTLHSFFTSSKAKAKTAAAAAAISNNNNNNNNQKNDETSAKATNHNKSDSVANQSEPKTANVSNNGDNTDHDNNDEPMIPTLVPMDRNAKWKVVENCMMVRSTKESPRTKAACFDVDGTLLVWRIAGWPSRLEHYEIWSRTVISKLQQLHDEEQYKLVLFSNQGAIRGAFGGKKATHVKSVMEWLAHIIDRPVHIVMSTNKKMGYHKPNPGMWTICQQHCNGGGEFNIQESFFVGDSVGDEDPQGGVDEEFAKNIGKLKGIETLTFYTPQDYFGPSDSDKRKRQGLMEGYEEPPAKALEARKALLGGYLEGPIVLLLTGPQGSGKSTFCEQLFAKQDELVARHGSPDSDADPLEQQEASCKTNDQLLWVHLSQDTINNGKPGKREAVEAKTREAIQDGRSVIVDRTHLDAEQRKYFVDIARELKVPVHVLVFQTSKEVITKRVRERTNHPGGVQGESGVRVAMIGLSKMVLPNYEDEDFDLITCVQREDGVKRLSGLYRQVLHEKEKATPSKGATVLEHNTVLSCGTSIPNLALGTMKVGKRIAHDVVKKALALGFEAIDTAPTYDNEEVVGQGLNAAGKNTFVIVKVPKRATQPSQVMDELNASLKTLKIEKADLLLLHWPCDVIASGTLKAVWQTMEDCVAQGKCRSLGVCNFTVDALRQLLPHCTIPPAINQVERHPLLPQMELLDFCMNNDIILQAHTPLGQNKLLSNDTVIRVAEKTKQSPAQVLLKWNLLQGVAVVCKCSKEEHQMEALETLGAKTTSPLGAIEMKILDTIGEKRRFVAPPFMTTPGNVYSWKD